MTKNVIDLTEVKIKRATAKVVRALAGADAELCKEVLAEALRRLDSEIVVEVVDGKLLAMEKPQNELP